MSNLFQRLTALLRRRNSDRFEETTPLLLDPAPEVVDTASATTDQAQSDLLDMNVDPAVADSIAAIDATIEATLAPLGDPDNPFTQTLDETPAEVASATPFESIPEPEPAPVFEAFGLSTDPDAPKVEAVEPEPQPETKVDEPFSTIQLKPEPAPLPSFTELYDLISAEVNKRTDNTVAVYERLLSATREELEQTRRNNTVAWSVGGVMSAIAAFGAIWASGEVSASRVEVSSLKQQVTTGQQASAEREQLRLDLAKIREVTAKAEVETLKSRLDQALAVSADRDRLRSELDTVTKAKSDVESELRITKATVAATTQPVTRANDRHAADTAAAQRLTGNAPVSAVGSDRPDVWSVLLNGNE